MSLSGSSIVFLVIGAVLLVLGSGRVAFYLAEPITEGQPSGRAGLSALPLTALQQGEATGAPALAPVQTIVSAPTPALPTVAPAATPVPAAPNQPGLTSSLTPPQSVTPFLQMGAASQANPVPVTDAMAPLGDKFLRVWHWVDKTGEFIYYDPLAPEESTLQAVVSGQTYLILVTESVTFIVNGQELELVCDEGDCWNKVVWP